MAVLSSSLDVRAAALVDRLRLIPDQYRSLSVPAAKVHGEYRIPPPLLDALIAHGLPYAQAERGPLFDRDDLMNISLDFGLRSVWTVATQNWPRALEASGAHAARCVIQYRMACPEPGHPGPCELAVLTPDRGWVAETATRPGAVLTLRTTATVTRRTEWPALPPALAALATRIGELEFKRLPSDLRWDLGFIRRTGMADCAGAATLLVHEAAALGLAARFSFGLVVTPPFSAPHCWADVDIDGTWVPLDPLMVTALVRWGMLSPAWTAGRSLGPIVARLSGRFQELARHNAVPVEVSMPTHYTTGA